MNVTIASSDHIEDEGEEEEVESSSLKYYSASLVVKKIDMRF